MPTAPRMMPSDDESISNSPGRLVAMGVALESVLVAVGAGLAWWTGAPCGTPVGLEEQGCASLLYAVVCGVAATLPMALGLLLLLRLRCVGVVRWRRRVVRRQLAPLFAKCSPMQVIVLSLSAGIGEEFLFRGVIQNSMQQALGGPVGLAVALLATSALFGLAHWISPLYALLAAVTGLYLGCVFLWSGCLLAPIIAHAAYDVLALWVLVRMAR